eukprot:GHVT01070714.1.p1 GENE.GHVT01070714.1~~GHVT01070714.1.p1  ORF type:complete len:233 (-),score=65.27 GHVT01070714.1:413-1111(-)
MGGIGSRPTLEDQLRENRRAINRSIRDLDRERQALERQEQQLIKDIRTAAAKNMMSSVRIMAKDLVRVRRHKEKFYEMRSQLQAVNLRLQTVKSTQAMSDSMKGVAKVMVKVNKQMDVPALQQIMRQFMTESERMGLTEEMMTDAVDEAVGAADDEEEQEAVIKQVLEEIGVDLSAQLSQAPLLGVGSAPTAVAAPAAAAAAAPVLASAAAPSSSSSALERSLEERLNNLKK